MFGEFSSWTWRAQNSGRHCVRAFCRQDYYPMFPMKLLSQSHMKQLTRVFFPVEFPTPRIYVTESSAIV